MTETHVPRWWQPLKDFYALVLPLRFNFVLLVVLGYALIGSDQGHDIMAHVAEAGGFTPGFWFCVASFGLALQIWFWSRQLLYLDLPQEQRRTRPFELWTTWLPRVFGLLVFAIVLGAFAVVHREARAAQEHVPDYAIPKYIVKLEILTISFAILFVALAIVRRAMLREPVMQKKSGFRELSRPARLIFYATLLLYVAFLFASFSIWLMNRLTSPFIVMFAFATWVTFGFFLVWLGHRWQMPLMTLLVVWAIVISPLADNHAVRTLDKPLAQRKSVSETFDAWMERLATAPGAKPNPVVFIVATEGGGIRAAYWTAAMLARLHQEPGFTDHLFAISGISGGSVGAAVFETALVRESGRVYDAATGALAYDALAPTLASMSSPDLLQRFVPFSLVRRDRAAQLEMGWEQGWREANQSSSPDALEQPLMSLFENDGAKTRPSLFLNGTSIDQGRRLITSNCLIGELRSAGDTLGILGRDVRISTSALNSARFPYFSPIGGLPTEHVADGGYFENSGSATALQISNVIRQTSSFARHQPRIVFIIIDYRTKEKPKYTRFANELFAPPRGLLATRGAHTIFALGELPNPRIELTLRPTVPQPLGWMLADASRGAMDAQARATSGEVAEGVRQVRELLAR